MLNQTINGTRVLEFHPPSAVLAEEELELLRKSRLILPILFRRSDDSSYARSTRRNSASASRSAITFRWSWRTPHVRDICLNGSKEKEADDPIRWAALLRRKTLCSACPHTLEASYVINQLQHHCDLFLNSY